MSDLLDPLDLPADDPKARGAADRYLLERIDSPDSAGFAEAFGALEAEFRPRGEIERREVVERWLRGEAECELPWQYHLVAARDERGELAAVRDCHVTIDRKRGECVVYLAHTLVLPRHRRTGLAAVMRAVPATLGRRAVASIDPPGRTELLLAAEMEPWEAGDHDSAVRLVAYGLAGFAACSPRQLPYCQPDFREPAVIERSGETGALPLLAVVRRAGQVGSSSLPRSLAEAYVRHLYAVFATHCAPQQLRAPRAHAMAALASAGDSVALLAMPASPDDVARLEPLSRAAVLPHQLAALRDVAQARPIKP